MTQVEPRSTWMKRDVQLTGRSAKTSTLLVRAFPPQWVRVNTFAKKEIEMHDSFRLMDLRLRGYQFEILSGPHEFPNLEQKRLSLLTLQEQQKLLSIAEQHVRTLTRLKLRVQGTTTISKRLQCHECAQGLRRRLVRSV